ncbi:MAG: energy transducer TonB [Proteobacteria bacterium]|nr:energy transducer TonB [Pseudomonadota bacterium]
MLSKKVLIISVSISIAIHIAILAAAGIISIRGNKHRNYFTVDLKETVEEEEKNTDKKEEVKTSHADDKDGTKETLDTAMYEREDTVNLDSMDTRYRSYLVKLRKRINRNWSYPKGAYIRKEEGTTVVKFSITKDGFLKNICIIMSSGFKSLDMETLDVVKSSAPYAPLPKSFNLSKLNIVANFQYSLVE